MIRFSAFLAAAVSAQLAPAPMPTYPDSTDGYSQIEIGTVDSFDFLIDFAGWSIIDDTENKAVEAWTDNFMTFAQNADESVYAQLEEVALAFPRGYALIGSFIFSKSPKPGDFFVASLAEADEDQNSERYAAYFEAGEYPFFMAYHGDIE